MELICNNILIYKKVTKKLNYKREVEEYEEK